MKVLVTSSTGLTGKAIIKALIQSGATVVSMVHSEKRSQEMKDLGASEVVVADITSENDLRRAMTGVDSVYYICPTAHPEEGRIGKLAIDIAKECSIKKFVYQSVLHSIEPSLTHHRQKLIVEQHLIDSGLNYVILQPAPFMQNVLNARDLLFKKHVFAQKFFTDKNSKNRINLIDVDDFAVAAAKTILNDDFKFVTFEICGPKNLDVNDMLNDMKSALSTDVDLKFFSDDEFVKISTANKVPKSKIETLLTMFKHYNDGDFCGSDFVCRQIISRKLTTFEEFLKKENK